MATPDEHKSQAEHNREFLKTIDRSKYADWAATVIFYTALHLVQMMLQTKGIDTESHRARNDQLRKHFRDVWRQYHKLYSFSRLSRYRCMETKECQVPAIEERLERLESEIEKVLSQS